MRRKNQKSYGESLRESIERLAVRKAGFREESTTKSKRELENKREIERILG